MRRIKFLGLAGVVLLATLGVLATTASAAPVPTWFECAKTKGTGNFTDKTCATASEPGKGDYTLKEGLGKGKTTKLKSGETVLEVVAPQGKFPITCGSGKGVATPALPNLEKGISIELKKCEFLGSKCATTGGKAVKLEGDGELIYVEPEKGSNVGLRINPPAGHETIAEFLCSNKGQPNFTKAKLFGAVIGVQTGDINVVNKESSLLFEAGPRYGTHVFGGTEYEPLVNIIGDAEEAGPAAACFASVPKSKAEEEAQSECQEEHPPHVIVGEYCGEFIEGVLHAPCTPLTYTGLNMTGAEKGEALEIKA